MTRPATSSVSETKRATVTVTCLRNFRSVWIRIISVVSTDAFEVSINTANHSAARPAT